MDKHIVEYLCMEYCTAINKNKLLIYANMDKSLKHVEFKTLTHIKELILNDCTYMKFKNGLFTVRKL